MAGLFDTFGGYVDPSTGMFVAANPQVQPGQGNESWNPARALGNAILPAAVDPNPASAYGPLQGPSTPPDAAAQLAAVGIPSDPNPPPPGPTGSSLWMPGQPTSTAAANAADSAAGLPPGSASAAAGAPPPPTPGPAAASQTPLVAPPQGNPQGAPQAPVAAPQAPPQASPQAPAQAPALAPGLAATPAAPGDQARAPNSDYTTFSPPPDAMKPIVDAAAAKYGVPQNVAYWMGSHESGWNPNAVGPQTSTGQAKGAWQFMDGTAAQYGLKDPTDFVSSTDAAMHKVADLAKANGGDWAAAVKQYGTFATGNPQQDAAAEAGFRTAMGGSSSLPLMGGGSTVTGGGQQSQTDPRRQQLDDLIAQMGNQKSSTFQLPYPGAADSSRQNQLLALAAGLMGGHSLGQGLSQGLTNMIGVRDSDQKAQMQANTEAMQMNRLGIDSDRNNNLMRAQLLGLGIRQQTADQGGQRIDLMGNKPAGSPMVVSNPDGTQKVVQRLASGDTIDLPGVTPQMLSIAQRQQAEKDKYDPTLQGGLAQAKDMSKKATDDITALQSGELADQNAHADNQTALAAAQKQIDGGSPELMGTTLKARATRALTEMGVIGDPSDLTAFQKATAAGRNSYLQNITNGHMAAVRAFGADKYFAQAVADINSNPKAAAWVIKAQDNGLQARQGWRQQYTQLRRTNPSAVDGQNYFDSQADFYHNWAQSHPLEAYQSASSGSGGASSGPKPLSAFDNK